MAETTASDWVILPEGDRPAPRELIGGKAWSLWRMAALGIAVPPAFVVSTEACRAFFTEGETLPAGLETEVRAATERLEERFGRRLGGAVRPLLLSVRSGAPVSMPGMLDTVLNLGVNDAVEAALARESGSARFAADTHRRFCELYGRVVLGAHVTVDPDGSAADARAAVAAASGREIPEDPRAQLRAAIAAVFRSTNSRRARTYRRHHGLPEDLGTAVTVQAMVFGNLDDRSGTGVLFTRNPLDGTDKPYGEYLARGQGEDVVSGATTPQPLAVLADQEPELHDALLRWGRALEAAERDVQDIEFTIEAGKLYLLQSRAAKRSAAAALQIASDLVRDGVVTVDEALARLTADQARTILRPALADRATDGAVRLAEGVSACRGVGVGTAVADPEEAVRRHAAGERVVLVRATTSPDDLHGMVVAEAIVTGRGGATSHAAVVGRALGTPCVVGAGDDVLDRLTGRVVTVDGDAGRVFDGALTLRRVDEAADPLVSEVAAWARERTSVAVVSLDAPQAVGALDLDAVDGGTDPERLPALLVGVTAARGRVLASDEGVRAAVAAGVRTIVAPSVVVALLAVLAAERDAAQQPANQEGRIDADAR